jgi:hypothetical protein
MSVFWNTERCSVVEIYRRFRGAFCRHLHGIDRRRETLNSH